MKRLSIFALGLLLCIGTIVNAQQTDNKSQDWNSGGTWKGGGVPGGTSTVSIVNGNNVSLAGTGQAASLAISRGSLSINGGTLTTTNGTTISGGTLTNSGTISGNVSITSGTLTNSGAINGNLTIGGGVVNINQGSSITGTITINEGTVNIAAGAVVDFSGATISESATVNITDGAVLIGYPGAQSISISLTASEWNFIGFPHVENISPLAANDAPSIWALAFDYTTNEWTENYLHWIEVGQQDALAFGNGIFAWPESDYTISASAPVSNENRTMTYSGIAGSDEAGRWFALANPFSFRL
ncbi:MAG: hypothetical protein SO444_06575, partial [Candidatus Onthomorpha sp.]|nr:hypothetical protein [Candidatus Onthomorpha sp.]